MCVCMCVCVCVYIYIYIYIVIVFWEKEIVTRPQTTSLKHDINLITDKTLL
jgi:hypothetical protein